TRVVLHGNGQEDMRSEFWCSMADRTVDLVDDGRVVAYRTRAGAGPTGHGGAVECGRAAGLSRGGCPLGCLSLCALCSGGRLDRRRGVGRRLGGQGARDALWPPE